MLNDACHELAHTVEVFRVPRTSAPLKGLANPNAERDMDELADSMLLDLFEHSSDSVLLVNLLRRVGGQWSGYWVLLGGFAMHARHEAYVLVLDVAAHKLAHHWLPVDYLTTCMHTQNSRGELRGYLRLTCGVLDTGPDLVSMV